MKTQSLIDFLKNTGSNSNSLSAFVGFDGFVDKLARVVQSRQADGIFKAYETIPEFAIKIATSAAKSADFEIMIQEERMGGNAPIMANALGCLGIEAICAGAVGRDTVHPVFTHQSDRCTFLPICDPGEALALEFDDGKLMLAILSSLGELDWNLIKESIGYDKFLSLVKDCRLFAMVNWSLLINASNIWAGFRNDVLSRVHCAGKHPLLFFDIADPSKHSSKSICECLELIATFQELGDTTLGLNENEARLVYGAIFGISEPLHVPLERVAEELFGSINVDVLLIHQREGCIVCINAGKVCLHGKLVEKPALSTGGGDNFNAGYCFGRLHGLQPVDAAQLGMAASSFYVEYGRSPNLSDLIYRLEKNRIEDVKWKS